MIEAPQGGQPHQQPPAEEPQPHLPSGPAMHSDGLPPPITAPTSFDTSGLSVRLLPDSLFGGVAGVTSVILALGALSAIVSWRPVLAIFCITLAAGLATTLGWVELTPKAVIIRKLTGTRTIANDDIVEVDMGVRSIQSTKLFFPVLNLRNGAPVKLTFLQSLSIDHCGSACKKILDMTDASVKGEAPKAAPSEADAGFTPLPGLASPQNGES